MLLRDSLTRSANGACGQHDRPFPRRKPNRQVIAEHRRRKALNQHLVKIRISDSEVDARRNHPVGD